MNGVFKDLTGRRFGRWRVVSRAVNSHQRQATWLCVCRCGAKRKVAASNLLRGWSRSCGCYNKAVISKRPFESLYNSLRRQSKDRRKICTVTYKQFIEFTNETVCYYCGDPVSWARHNLKLNGYGYNLDRKDNTKGYSKKNCVVCCKICNCMKRALNHRNFITHAKKVARSLHGRST